MRKGMHNQFRFYICKKLERHIQGDKLNASKKFLAYVFISIMIIFLLVDNVKAGHFTGDTFEERKAAYINDQGNYWAIHDPNNDCDLSDGSRIPCWYIKAVWAWLESDTNSDKVSQTIDMLTYAHPGGQNGNPSYPYNSYWNAGDQSAKVWALRIALQYRDRISGSDYDKILNRYRPDNLPTAVFATGAPNWVFHQAPAYYLYAEHFRDDNGEEYETVYSAGSSGTQSFCYTSNCYSVGGEYKTLNLVGDWLGYYFDKVMEDGHNELLGNYTASNTQGLRLLYDFAQSETIKTKAKMLADFILLESVLNFSARHWLGGHGRSYAGADYDESYSHGLPAFSIYWKDLSSVTYYSGPYMSAYVSSYRLPPVLEDIGQIDKEDDSYYRLIRGHISALGSYEYSYVTRNYNLGGAGQGSGWELNILCHDDDSRSYDYENKGIPFKLWVNDDGNPQETTRRGRNGHQHRNAIFVTGHTTLHVSLGDNRWDKTDSGGGWDFYQEGNVVVAIGTGGGNTGIEVCTIGVDYPSYDAFKNAMINNASVGSSFVTSKGKIITDSYIDYGDAFSSLPFDRLEAWEGHAGQNDERKLVDWANKVMTISKRGRTCRYDFNNWTYRCEEGNVYEEEDVNRDVNVDSLDLIYVVNVISAAEYDPNADVNNDGYVNSLDLTRIVNKILERE